eukprot:m.351290 g.351290  ORF g.351290 m.351290 type:complete len:513 (-) comp20696_c0_seq4:434-1972(-)
MRAIMCSRFLAPIRIYKYRRMVQRHSCRNLYQYLFSKDLRVSQAHYFHSNMYQRCVNKDPSGKRDRFVENLSEKDAATLLAYYDLCSDESNEDSMSPDDFDETAADEYSDGRTIFECNSAIDTSTQIRVVEYHRLLRGGTPRDCMAAAKKIPGAILRELQIFDGKKHNVFNVAPTQSLVDMGDPSRVVLEYLCDIFACTALRDSEAPPPKRVCILGLGAGSAVSYCRSQFPGCDIDAVEIDQSIVDVAQEYFHLGGSNANGLQITNDGIGEPGSACEVIVGNHACHAALRAACDSTLATRSSGAPDNSQNNNADASVAACSPNGKTRVFVQNAAQFREAAVTSFVSPQITSREFISNSQALPRYDFIVHDIDVAVVDDAANGRDGLFSLQAMQQWMSLLNTGGVFVCNYMAANTKDCSPDVLQCRQRAIEASQKQFANIFPNVYKVASTENNVVIAGVLGPEGIGPSEDLSTTTHPLAIPVLEKRGVDMYLDGHMTAHVLAHVDLIAPFQSS